MPAISPTAINRTPKFTILVTEEREPAFHLNWNAVRQKGLPVNRVMIVGMLVFAVSPGFARRARVDFDHNVHFSSYKTYSWAPWSNGQPSEPPFPNQLMQERITGFVEEALAARGLKHVATGGDLLIKCRVNISEQPVFTTFSSGLGPGWGGGWGWGPGWGWGSGIATTTVQTFYEGTLVVDIVDARRNQLVFQGTSTHTVSSRPARNTKKFAHAVNEVFEKYPPRL